MVVAALLKIVSVDDDVIFEEYMLSDGARSDKIRTALEGLKNIEYYFAESDRVAIRTLLLP